MNQQPKETCQRACRGPLTHFKTKVELLFYLYEKVLFYGPFLALNDQLANKEFANARSLVNVRRFLLHHYDLFCQISTQK